MEIYLCRVTHIYFSQLLAFLVVLVAYSIICCDSYLHLPGSVPWHRARHGEDLTSYTTFTFHTHYHKS